MIFNTLLCCLIYLTSSRPQMASCRFEGREGVIWLALGLLSYLLCKHSLPLIGIMFDIFSCNLTFNASSLRVPSERSRVEGNEDCFWLALGSVPFYVQSSLSIARFVMRTWPF